tara:strand:+ start:415 stop:1743 length:1329 start_codon:yes stop_codon:yes gene_type:complete
LSLPSRSEIDNVSDYQFTEISLISERFSERIDIRELVTDVEIYEHIELPYLTGRITTVDQAGFSYAINFMGGEKVEIGVKSSLKGSKTIKKLFFMERIISTVKNNDHTEVNHFRIVEDIYYISNLINVNKYYSGTAGDIVQRISNNFLNKQVGTNGTDQGDSMQVIIPNLEPLEAMMWIRNRMTTSEGYPFYLFSTFVGDNLGLINLGDLLRNTPINPERPFLGYQNASTSLTPGVPSSVLNNFQFEESSNIYKLIQQGLYGSEYQFYNTLSDLKNKFTFDVIKDLIAPLIGSDVLQANPVPTVTNEYELDGTPFNEIKSRSITRIGGSGAFRTADAYETSYDETTITSDYKRIVLSKAMFELLKKDPVTFAVDGIKFISGQGHLTVGNNILVDFLNSRVGATDGRKDSKRSGSYLIYAAKHMFKKEKYDLVLTGVKMGKLK